MTVLRGLQDAAAHLAGGAATCLTVGAFDGVHVGHQALFACVADEAARRSLRSAVVTFHPHPAAVLGNAAEFRCLATHDENAALLAEQPLDHVVVLEFTRDLAALSARGFVADVLVAGLGMGCLVLGPGHRFGRGGEGSEVTAREWAEELHYDVVAVERVASEGDDVSSTRVRDTLSKGDVALAANMLGRPYRVSGVVSPGARRGAKLGFPTANIRPAPCKVLPSSGVYACRAVVGESAAQPAVVYVGSSPTFRGRTETLVECHLLTPPEGGRDLYGERLQVMFVERLRGDRVFAGPEELIEQMRRDVARAWEIL
jgi:riboflavin kinase / FMN adenylyltransferase